MKKVLITGCSSGFGYLAALKFAREGYYVYATSRNLKKEGIIHLKKVSDNENVKLEILELDVTSRKSIEKVVSSIDSLDILINNAGYGALGRVDSFTEDEVRDQMETNYFGLYNTTMAFLPMLKESKGKVINLSSIAGIVAATGYGIYSSSKFAVEALSSSLRVEMKQYGVSVSVINPGGFDTKFWDNSSGRSKTGDGGNGKLYESIIGSIKKLKLRDPSRVSNLMYKISEKRNPRFHNIIGVDARLTVFLKKILPDSLFMKMMEGVSNS